MREDLHQTFHRVQKQDHHNLSHLHLAEEVEACPDVLMSDRTADLIVQVKIDLVLGISHRLVIAAEVGHLPGLEVEVAHTAMSVRSSDLSSVLVRTIAVGVMMDGHAEMLLRSTLDPTLILETVMGTVADRSRLCILTG